MIGAGDPAGVIALHAGAADEDVLDRLVQGMTHMQHTGDGGRGDDNGIRLALVGFRTEITLLHPMSVPALFCLSGKIIFR
jgi:hypothetical protein